MLGNKMQSKEEKPAHMWKARLAYSMQKALVKW